MSRNSFFQIKNLDSCNEIFKTRAGSIFTLFHVNIRSIRKHWCEFQLAIDSVRFIADVFVLTEINIHDEDVGQFSLPGFNSTFYTRDKKRGGGIAVFLKDDLFFSEVKFSIRSCETISLRILTSVYNIYLLACYRPPSGNVSEFLSDLRDCLQTLPTNASLCLVGDFNIDLLKPSRALVCEYLTLLADHGVEPAIQAPTREELLGDKIVISSIDHINLRSSTSTTKAAVISYKLSDHYFIGCQLEFPGDALVTGISNKHHVEIVDRHSLDNCISTYDWLTFQHSVSRSDIYVTFVQLFRQFTEASKKIIVVKQRKDNIRWLNKDILSVIKLKEIAWKRCRRSPHNSILKAEFRTIRNKVSALIRSAKRLYFQKQFSDSRRNSAKTWSLINELRGVTYPHIQNFDGAFGLNSLATATTFNNFFASFSGRARPSATAAFSSPSLNSASAFLPEMTSQDLESIILGLKPNKLPGYDGICLSDLRRNFRYLKDTLLLMLNTMIETGSIPIELKTAIVKPLFKGGQRGQVENYRPISILPCIAKILEKFIYITMSSFVEKCNIISPNQYGFVPGRGTQPLLEALSDEINLGFENNLFICACFLDVKKAFDTVSHSMLLQKLSTVGFRGPFLTLLTNFLQDRSQLVSIKGIHSVKVSLKSGVPQGSVLSPLLFNIYVNDMSTSVSNCSLYQYADDTLLLTSHLTYSRAMEMLQECSLGLMNWFAHNLIDINVSKTKLVCFHNPLKLVDLNTHLFLHTSHCVNCQCTPIAFSDTVKYLGIIFDSDLSWNSHLTRLCSKLRSVSCLMYHIKAFLPLNLRKLIVHSLAYGSLRYGITIFGNCSGLWQAKINNILKGMLRNVYYRPTTSSQDMFQILSMPNFHSLFVETVVLGHYWNTDFKTPHPNIRQLRTVPRFVITKCYTRYGKNLRSFYVPRIFNSLPSNFPDFTSRKKLRKSLRLLLSPDESI